MVAARKRPRLALETGPALTGRPQLCLFEHLLNHFDERC
jgi:hypothetical protein